MIGRALSSTRGSTARSPAVDGHRWHCAADLRKRVGERWSRSVADDASATHLPRAKQELRTRHYEGHPAFVGRRWRGWTVMGSAAWVGTGCAAGGPGDANRECVLVPEGRGTFVCPLAAGHGS